MTRRFAAIALLMLLAGPAPAEERLEFFPAHWVEREDVLRPRVAAFEFSSMAFRSAQEGWIVGDRFVLHITGDHLELATPRLNNVWMNDVVFASPDAGWMSGSRIRWTGSAVFQYKAGAWTRDPRLDQTYLGGLDWYAAGFLPLAADEVLLHVRNPYWRNPIYGWTILQESESLQFDGERWRFSPWPLTWPGRFPNDTCRMPDGTQWIAGQTSSAAAPGAAFFARRRAGEWEQVTAPPLADHLTHVLRIACLGTGELVALIDGRDRFWDRSPRLYLYLFDGEWQRMGLPAGIGRGHSAVMAARQPNEIWLLARCLSFLGHCPQHFYRWRKGEWTEVSPPLLPDGRRTGYSVFELQFPSADEGWALASDSVSDPARTLIFHYRDGVWRNRNWDWHFWDQPWFGARGY